VSARRDGIAGLVLTVALGASAASAAAETRYGLELPDGDSASYTLELDLRHPGTLAVRATWDGRRSISLRLTPGGDDGASVRRSGSSPLELEAAIPAGALPARWTLQVRAIPGRGAARVDLAVRLPAPPPPPPVAAAPAEPEPPPWLRPLASTGPQSPAWDRFRVASERLRVDVLADPRARDTCRWQEEMLRWLADVWQRRDAGVPDPATRDVLADLVAASRAVEGMRGSRDPLLAGPVPDDPRRADVWLQLRSVQVRAIEERLDRALTRVLREHAAALEAWDWPLRFVSCVTACERFFDERVRLGEDRAANRDLAGAQWDRIVLGTAALDALVRTADHDAVGRSASDGASVR